MMRSMTTTGATLALGLLLAAPASAATLISPPLVAEGENFFDCYLVNVSKKSREVLIEVFSREGTVVESVETTLGPGEEDVARAGSELLPRYCKFTVQGDKQHFRGSVLVRQTGVGAISALPAN
ncbi:MAG: hypothetical protein SF182_27465 [Deltaproteobacteria bacterium]|nr:hypothetical protein [Deltaproteobacteria bacterium]